MYPGPKMLFFFDPAIPFYRISSKSIVWNMHRSSAIPIISYNDANYMLWTLLSRATWSKCMLSFVYILIDYKKTSL